MTHHHIQDRRGRIGDITEERGDGVFAKPHGAHYIVDDYNGTTGVPGARLITATWWMCQLDGTLRGLWADSPLDGFTTAIFTD